MKTPSQARTTSLPNPLIPPSFRSAMFQRRRLSTSWASPAKGWPREVTREQTGVARGYFQPSGEPHEPPGAPRFSVPAKVRRCGPPLWDRDNHSACSAGRQALRIHNASFALRRSELLWTYGRSTNSRELVIAQLPSTTQGSQGESRKKI